MDYKAFPDTNILMHHAEQLFDTYNKIKLNGVTLEELDKLKNSSDCEKAYCARSAVRCINAHESKIEYVLRETDFKLPDYFDTQRNDNKIISILKAECESDNRVIGISNDLLFMHKCKLLNVPCVPFDAVVHSDSYTGIRETSITEQEYVELMEGLENNPYNLYPNEYLIINNTTNNDQYLLIWNGKFFEEVKARTISNKYMQKINPLDIYQKAFVHMLQNDNAKIKITDAPYGCGKTFLMLHWALQMIDKDKYKKLYFVKSDNPPKGRKEYPALPGSIAEKSEGLLGVLRDITSEDKLSDILVRNEKLEILPIQFAKGRSLQNSILFINEAQDFLPSEMERLLSRMGENSVALLDGSTSQIDNRHCLIRNGLTVASENWKTENNAAQVNLVTDFRSEISRQVGRMDWSD